MSSAFLFFFRKLMKNSDNAAGVELVNKGGAFTHQSFVCMIRVEGERMLYFEYVS